MSLPVEALYVPKSITFTGDPTNGFTVKVKAPTVGSIALAIGLVFFAFVGAPLLAIANGMLALLAFIGSLAGAWFLAQSGSPTMRVSREGVEVGGRLYRAADISHFADYSDDGWGKQFLTIGKLDHLSLGYGIYNVGLPYVMPKHELVKAALFLTNMLRSQGAEVAKDRDRKIQQAEVF